MEPKTSLVMFASLAIVATVITPTYSSANGGTDCAACVILVSLAEQLAQVHATDIVSAAEKFCSYLPSPLDLACTTLLNEYGEVLIDLVDEHATADLACHDIGICTQDPNKDFCHLYPLPSSFNHRQYAANRPSAARFPTFKKYDFCNLPGVKELCDGINRVSEHNPIQDKDNDGFSEEVNVLRGTFWKGRDCDGNNPSYYPGRTAINSDRIADSNCNGIHGVDPKSGRPFEDLYCNKTQQRGIVILGDSAGAHFRIPENYLMAEVLNENTFQDAVTLIANEGDWPMLSSTTAISKENSWPQSIRGPIDSLYIRLREHNLCNHRDYQNIGVNGARSSSMNTIVKSLSRRRPFDKPQIVFLSLIGNDVCNGHMDTIADMTTPTEFRENTMVTLQYLDSVLPKNSSVLITGLADGRVLWDLLSKRYHPIGQLNRDVTYTDLYSFLNCLEVSPCTGWMSTNESLRNFTSQRAANLSIVAQSVANKEKFNNFDIHYIDFDIQAIIKMWQKQGGEAWEVIEPVDGFHPGQISQALSAEYMWNQLQTKYPHVLGPANPNNNKIKEVFGNQGGH